MTDQPSASGLLAGARADLLRTAVDAVQRASAICRSVQTALVTADTQTKKDRSPVTVADFAAQAAVRLSLGAAFPDLPMVGEESADALRTPEAAAQRQLVVRHAAAVLPEIAPDEAAVLDAIDACNDAGGGSGRRWVLDPIDGTKGYLRRDQYAVALALLEDGVPVLGILGCPAMPREDGSGGTGCLFVASAGEGAVQADLGEEPSSPDELLRAARPVTTTDLTDPSGAVFCESVESAHSAHDRHAAIAAHLGVTGPSFRIDSQCKYGAVARGQASIYLRLPTSATYREKIWDHAAGWAVVTEAGGRVTDVEGRDLDFTLGRTLDGNRGVVATNGALHDAVLEAIRATAGDG